MNQREFIEYTLEKPVMPNLAELASDSVRFGRGYSHAPWTLPSHMSMLTGLYPYQHGRDVPVFYYVDRPDEITKKNILCATIADYATANGYEAVAFTGSGSISGVYGHGKGFQDYNEFPRNAGRKKFFDSPLSAPEAAEWINKNFRKPFFLFYHTYDLHHTPKLYEDLEMLDQSLGKVIDALKKKGIYDKSFIILTGDHGRDVIRKNNKCSAHGVGHYEENLNVPYLVKFLKSARRGDENTMLVRHVDFLPTFLDALKIPYPKYEGPGVSIFKRLADMEKDGFDFEEIDSLSQADGYCARREAVRWKQYKYIKQLMDSESQGFKTKDNFSDKRCEDCDDETIEELYDLRYDPWEIDNLVYKKEYAHIVEDGRNRLARLKTFRLMYVEDTQGMAPIPDNKVIESLKSLGYIQ